MNIDYSTPKREKLKNGYKKRTIQSYLFPIEYTIERYLNPSAISDPTIPPIKVRSEVFFQNSGGYRLIYEYYCLEECMPEAFGYLYLYAASILKAYELRRDEAEVSGKNLAIERAMDIGFELNSLFYALISVNEFDTAKKISQYNNKLIFYMLNEEYDKAQEILNEIPDNPDEKKEVYYTSSPYLKKIYQAIISKNEKDFEAAMLYRVKKYRRYTYDYSFILDTCSITMIKFARKRGLDYHFDIAEIPKYFLDENIHVDKELYKLPEVPLRNSDV
jgi:hypothetical protein